MEYNLSLKNFYNGKKEQNPFVRIHILKYKDQKFLLSWVLEFLILSSFGVFLT